MRSRRQPTSSFPLDYFPFCVSSPGRGNGGGTSSLMSALYTPQRESKGWSFDHFFSASGFADLLRSQLAQGEKKQALDYLFSSFPMAAKRKSAPRGLASQAPYPTPLTMVLSPCIMYGVGYIASYLKCYHFRACEGA